MDTTSEPIPLDRSRSEQRASAGAAAAGEQITWRDGPGISMALVAGRPVGHVLQVPAVEVRRGGAVGRAPSRRCKRVWSAMLYGGSRTRVRTRAAAQAEVERFHVTEPDAAEQRTLKRAA